jgi:hypothetical protein
MRAHHLLLVLAYACTPARAPSPGANCVGRSWYAGTTDPNAPTMVLNYKDDTPADTFVPEDICLLIDDQAMLTSDHRNVVVPRLPIREMLTWRASVPRGKHNVSILVRFGKKNAFDVVSSREFDVKGDVTVDAIVRHEPATTRVNPGVGRRAQTETTIEEHAVMHWYESNGVPALPKPPPPPEDEPVPSATTTSTPLPPTWGVSP